MTYSQSITPNPDIPCKPGWCLAFVNEAFGARKVYGSATAAWNASATKHEDYNFPAGCWVPVWFALANEPNGHVALMAPDGSVYSTSDLTTIPHHHPDLADLIGYYAYYGMPLTYLGWTEDVEGTLVISSDGIAAMGENITPLEQDWLDMATKEEVKAALAELLDEKRADAEGVQTSIRDLTYIMRSLVHDVPRALLDTTIPRAGGEFGGDTSLRGVLAYADQKHIEALRATVQAAHGDGVSADAIIKAVQAGLAAGVKVEATVKVGE